MRKKYYLTDEEFNVLNRISVKSGMDCWFYIYDRKDGSTAFKDLEENKELSLRTGIRLMNDGLTDYSDYGFFDGEIEIYENLKKKLKI